MNESAPNVDVAASQLERFCGAMIIEFCMERGKQPETDEDMSRIATAATAWASTAGIDGQASTQLVERALAIIQKGN